MDSRFGAEIGFDDFWVFLHDSRFARGDDLPVIEHVNPVGDVHDDAHVVLDEKDGDALGQDFADEIHEFLAFRRVHACGGFIEQQEDGSCGEGPRDFEAALKSVGQLRGELISVGSEAAEIEIAECGELDFSFLAPYRGRTEDSADQAGLGARMESDFDVFQGSQIGEEADVLKSPRDAEGRDLVWSQTFDSMEALVPTAKDDLASGGRDAARDGVEERGFAGPVGPDETRHFPAGQADGNVAHGGDAAEVFPDVF